MNGRLPDIAIPVTPELEARIAEHAREAANLHIGMLPVMYISTKITGRDGNIIEERRYKANSVNRNFYNQLCVTLIGSTANDSTFGAGYLNFKDTGGTVRKTTTQNNMGIDAWSNSGSSNALSAYAGAGTATAGIIIGTGTGAEDFEGYVIGTLIAHGTGAGQMQYGAVAYGAAAGVYTAGTKTWAQTIVRSFVNSSGGSINVGECAIYTGCLYQSSYKGMIERTLFDPVKAVANGKTLTITYTLSFTFPA